MYRYTLIYRVTLSIVYRVTYLIYRFSLIYIISLDYKKISSIFYNITYLNIVYNNISSNLVHVNSLEYII